MPSKRPKLQINLDEEINIKFEIIRKKQRRSRANQGEYIIEKYIEDYEKEYGEIIIDTPTSER